MITCKNCGHEFQGKFCPQCRQPAHTQRITWHEVLHHLQHALIHADRGLIYTIKELLLRPGRMLREYLAGKRVNHFNPFLFLLIVSGLCSLLFFYFHLALPVREISLEHVETFSATMAHKYFAMVGLLFVFLLTFSDYILYRKYGYLMPELVVSNTYQASQVIVFTLAMIPLLLLQEKFWDGRDPLLDLRTLFKALIIAYLFIVRYQFYEARGKGGLIVKIILQLVLLVVAYQFLISRAIRWLVD